MICKHCNLIVARKFNTQLYCSSKCKDDHYRQGIKDSNNRTIETSSHSEAIKDFFKRGGKVQRIPPEERPPKWEYLLTNLFEDQDDQIAPLYQ
tara:strand:- start:2119 stop:2397 length:279 start_codon:yes stop_codon:yes gene_type:complete